MNYKSLAISATTLLLLSGCATAPVVIDSYCQSYSLIRPSKADTPGTLKQVLRENNKYRSVCPEPPK